MTHRQRKTISSNSLLSNKMLTKFLKDNKCFDEYMNNVIGRIERHADYKDYGIKNISKAISSAFSWSGSKEGVDYWINISNKWERQFRIICELKRK